MAELRDLRVHTCALNARDLDALSRQAIPHAACICDGHWVGEGPEAVRLALEKLIVPELPHLVRELRR